MKFYRPSARINLLACPFILAGRKSYIFLHALEQKVPKNAKWEKVDGCNVVLIGEVGDQMRQFLDQYKNKEIDEILGMHPSTITVLRRHFGVKVATGRGRNAKKQL